MNSIIGAYKEYIIIERQSLNELEAEVRTKFETAQDDHNVEDLRHAKVWLKAIEWIKENNIYTRDFEMKA